MPHLADTIPKGRRFGDRSGWWARLTTLAGRFAGGWCVNAARQLETSTIHT
jgi:hypothetical protein